MKIRPGTVLTVIAVLVLSAWAWRQLGRTPTIPTASGANCSQQAIRAVNDVVERAILSGRCARQARPAS